MTVVTFLCGNEYSTEIREDAPCHYHLTITSQYACPLNVITEKLDISCGLWFPNAAFFSPENGGNFGGIVASRQYFIDLCHKLVLVKVWLRENKFVWGSRRVDIYG
jgi:hypothetical protein